MFCAGEPFGRSKAVSGAQQGAQGLHGKKVKSTLPYFCSCYTRNGLRATLVAESSRAITTSFSEKTMLQRNRTSEASVEIYVTFYINLAFFPQEYTSSSRAVH